MFDGASETGVYSYALTSPRPTSPVTDHVRGPVTNQLAEIVRVLRLEIQLVLKPQNQSTHNAEIIKFDVAA